MVVWYLECRLWGDSSVISFPSGVVVLVLNIQRVPSHYDLLSIWCVECIVNIVERSVMSSLNVLWFGSQSSIHFFTIWWFACLVPKMVIHCGEVSPCFSSGGLLRIIIFFIVWCLEYIVHLWRSVVGFPSGALI